MAEVKTSIASKTQASLSQNEDDKTITQRVIESKSATAVKTAATNADAKD
jgi:hypothetical protein